MHNKNDQKKTAKMAKFRQHSRAYTIPELRVIFDTFDLQGRVKNKSQQNKNKYNASTNTTRDTENIPYWIRVLENLRVTAEWECTKPWLPIYREANNNSYQNPRKFWCPSLPFLPQWICFNYARDWIIVRRRQTGFEIEVTHYN